MARAHISEKECGMQPHEAFMVQLGEILGFLINSGLDVTSAIQAALGLL